ncbi:MAG: hypothetical protein DK305_000241 [Chloroflexi bacterium]|nr:MAG: hypothetical protein DK305_000241 [Chloroflexota bacterium]
MKYKKRLLYKNINNIKKILLKAKNAK